MPLQLLNLGVIIPRLFYRAFSTRTPRGTHSILHTSACDYVHSFFVDRFCGAQCTPHDQLWSRLSTSDLDVCHHNAVQRCPTPHRHLWCNLLRSCLCCIQI